MILLAAFFSSGLFGQGDQGIDRKPAVAGQFYPSDKDELNAELRSLFSKAIPNKHENVLAVISPHAGYVFSGEVAASAFNQIDTTKHYDNVFVIASSHRMTFDGASIYTKGNFITPSGTVKVNRKLAGELVSEYPVFTDKTEAHLYEHSLEVQLPFLQYRLGKDFQMVPIIVATQNKETCKKIAQALKPYFNEKNLFVISTDFSHYPDYDDACAVDKRTAEAIASNSVEVLANTLQFNEEQDIPGLSTSLCSWTSVMTLMYMTEGDSNLEYHIIKYKNSGDAKYYGDKDRVVGYNAISVVKKKQQGDQGFTLSEGDQKVLLNIARKTLESYIINAQTPKLDPQSYSTAISAPSGAFVSLHIGEALRGCIGRFDATEPLYKVVQNMTISSSTQDYRFPRVTPEEVNDITIEISVLSPMRKIKSIDEIILGRHGIYIKKGYSSGTFLPQVATQTGWTKEEFLGHCAQDKAHIGWNGWKDAEIYVYEAFVFSEK